MAEESLRRLPLDWAGRIGRREKAPKEVRRAPRLACGLGTGRGRDFDGIGAGQLVHTAPEIGGGGGDGWTETVIIDFWYSNHEILWYSANDGHGCIMHALRVQGGPELWRTF